MKRNLKIFLAAFCCLPGVAALSQGTTDDYIILRNLASPTDSIGEVPVSILELVANYYSPSKERAGDSKNNYQYPEKKKSERPQPRATTNGVLTYISNIFSEHAYDEYGSWVPDEPLNSKSFTNNPSLNYRQSKFSTYKLPADYSFPVYSLGDVKMPTNGAYTSFFGYRPKFGRFHKGIDIALKVGDTVRCSLPGVVVRIKCDPKGYGNYVVVSHDGDLETLYAHLTRELVVAGQKLKAGDAIGLGGNTGNATGPHLHFETRVKGEAIDPLFYLPRKAVRK